jgi:hypothetical protein
MHVHYYIYIYILMYTYAFAIVYVLVRIIYLLYINHIIYICRSPLNLGFDLMFDVTFMHSHEGILKCKQALCHIPTSVESVYID